MLSPKKKKIFYYENGLFQTDSEENFVLDHHDFEYHLGFSENKNGEIEGYAIKGYIAQHHLGTFESEDDPQAFDEYVRYLANLRPNKDAPLYFKTLEEAYDHQKQLLIESYGKENEEKIEALNNEYRQFIEREIKKLINQS